MHIVEGEHGHGHSHHTHEHTHADGQVHSHEHCHTEGHEGEHTHSHEHCGTCAGGCGQKPANEQEALLTYMLDHNKHHAAELLEVARQLRADGKEEVAAQIDKAVENFDKGNLYLSVALSLVK